MIAGAFITSERIQYMDYLLPPFTHLAASVWVPKDQGFEYRHWPDLKGRRGSTLINNSFGQGFDRYAEKNLQIVNVRTISSPLKWPLLGVLIMFSISNAEGRLSLSAWGWQKNL